MSDPVNHPDHYTHGGIECIEATQASMTADQSRRIARGRSTSTCGG